METKGIEEMTREELIELVSSLNKELEETKQGLAQSKRWWSEAVEDRNLLEKKIAAAKAFFEVM